MIGHPIAGNGHRYLSYTCSGYMRIGRSVCRSVHVLAAALEGEVWNAIRDHLAAPGWKDEVRQTLDVMVRAEFGHAAEHRADELQQQLNALERQIANIVDAVKTSGRFSEAMNHALTDLETQRETVRGALREAQGRAAREIGTDALAAEIIAHFGKFERLVTDGLSIEERKELLRCYVHQVDISHSPTNVQADVWLYKIPIPKTQMTPALNGIEPIIARVNCGGRNLTLVKDLDETLRAYVTRRFIALKRPYRHYDRPAA
jgi:DNA-binding transcriptional MerR regulator